MHKLICSCRSHPRCHFSLKYNYGFLCFRPVGYFGREPLLPKATSQYLSVHSLDCLLPSNNARLRSHSHLQQSMCLHCNNFGKWGLCAPAGIDWLYARIAKPRNYLTFRQLSWWIRVWCCCGTYMLCPTVNARHDLWLQKTWRYCHNHHIVLLEYYLERLVRINEMLVKTELWFEPSEVA